MSDIYVGLKAQNIDIGTEMPEITGIRLVVDSDHEYVVGDATGRTLEVECPWGTEDMAKSILATMSGIQYRPYAAERAMLDPAFELGDSVMVGGVSSAIINSDIIYNGAALANIEAPALDEIDDEYPAQQTRASSFERQLAYTRSLISKSAEEIKLEVKGIGDKYTALAVTLEGVTITDEEGVTRIKGGSIDTSTLSVSFADVTGRLKSNRIDLYSDLTVHADRACKIAGGLLGYTTSALDGTAGIHIQSVDANGAYTEDRGEFVATAHGAKMMYGSNSQVFLAKNTDGSYVFTVELAGKKLLTIDSNKGVTIDDLNLENVTVTPVFL